MIQFECIVSQPYDENTYVVFDATSKKCFIVDPGFEPAKIEQFLDQQGLTPVAIVNTHGHVDHIAGNRAMKERYPNVPLIIGHGDAPMLSDPMLNLSAWGGAPLISPPADQLTCEGETIRLLDIDWQVREIPGHSPGHIVYIAKLEDRTFVIGGDVLFAGSVGRVDFPGGSGPLLLSGIQEKLYTLADDALVYPGHGPTTTIGVEKKNNPFTRSKTWLR